MSLFWYALLCVFSCFAIILKKTRELVALLLLSYGCLVTVYVLWLLLMVSWVSLQWVIVVFSDHTHLHFGAITNSPLIIMRKVPLNITEASYELINYVNF